jgi:HSP20 family protein
MANDTSSRDGPSRQQASERAQSTTTTPQQGSGDPRAGGQGAGNQGQRDYAQGSGSGRGATYDEGRGAGRAPGQQGLSTWQGGRDTPLAGIQRRGSSSLMPYGSLHEGGFGGGPFSIMRRISDEMDRLFENFGMGRGFGLDAGGWNDSERQRGQNAPSIWSPHIDVCERNGKLLIQADLPGIRREDVNVRIEQDAIVIQGQRHQQQQSNEGGYYRSERSYGSFYRTIPLPEGTDGESATASFRDGVLEIELDAPRPQQRGRTLEIRDGGSGAGSTPAGHAGTASGATYAGGATGSAQRTGSTTHNPSGAGGSQSGNAA